MSEVNIVATLTHSLSISKRSGPLPWQWSP
ncbi:Uncharacterised protein [Raoultella terrigena]|uniref:Uncharacterized protein n=1 Tax=Raoultella terrigena TaxID=577 RepID=A0A7Z9CSD1_RAOTE|nr:Uncharacterised protein [Raoultella terrigena]